ncbi:MAG: GAF domain-containing protein, partial [Pseudolabrys sp.]
TRLLNELRQRTDDLTESLEQQTATSEILEVISNSPTDTQPVFDAIVRSGLNLFPDAVVTISLPDRDLIKLGAIGGVDEAGVEALRGRFPMPLSREFITGTAILDQREIDIANAHEPPNELRAGAQNLLAGGYSAMTVLPMVRGDETIGTLNVVRRNPGPLSDKQRELLRTFANQAVIAIENTRLFNELRHRTDDLSESLEQQTATSEVLKVISSSPGELKPVFDALLANAVRICDAKFGVLFLTEGDAFRYVALHGAPPAFAEARRREPVTRVKPGTTIGRVAATKKPAQTTDIRAEPAYTSDPERIPILELAGARTILGVPMLKESQLVGAIVIYRQEVRPFTDKQIDLLSNFAAQAVIAIENTRLLNELRQRTDDLTESLEQQTATSEVLRIISSSPGDLEPVFEAMLQNSVRICEAGFGQMFLCEGDNVRLVAAVGVPTVLVEFDKLRGTFQPSPGGGLDGVMRTKQVVHIADLLSEHASYPPTRLGGARSYIAVPMLKENKLVGAIAIYRQEVRPFTDKQIDLVKNFAAQAVIAIENTRLLNELRQRTADLSKSLEELRTTQDRLVQTQ